MQRSLHSYTILGLLVASIARVAPAAPSNDAFTNALPITSEFGSFTNQTTVGSTSETNPWTNCPAPYWSSSPFVCPGYTTNGHDVWYKWLYGWIISGANTYGNRAVAYDLWIDHCTNDLSIRVYYTTNIYDYVTVSSKDRFTQRKTGKNAMVTFLFDAMTPPDAGVSAAWWWENMWLRIQVDGTNTGPFDLHWRRSDIPNIGSLTNFSAFTTPIDRTVIYIGGLSISDVSTQWTGYYTMGETQRPGTYRAQYAGGWYQLAAAATNGVTDALGVYHPPGPRIMDANFEVLYNASVDATNCDSWQPGCAAASLFTRTNGTYTDPEDPLWAAMFQRFAVKTFRHDGGRIGLQFRDFYGMVAGYPNGKWVGPVSRPADVLPQAVTPDYGYEDNTWHDPPVSVLVWRLIPKLKFALVNAWDIGSWSRTPTCFFRLKNDTSLDLAGVRIYKKTDAGAATQISTNAFDSYGLASRTFQLSLTNLPLVETLYFDLTGDPDVPAFPLVVDFTPDLELYRSTFNGVVNDGGVDKWWCTVRFKNNGLGPWMNQPIGSLVAGQRDGSSVTYPDGQALYPFVFNDAWLNFYACPPANASAATFSFQVTDSGWTSPLLTATISGTPLGYGSPAGDGLSSGWSSSSGAQASSSN